MARVSLSDVTKAFDTTVAVRDFSVEVADGELVSFLGPSGCGKTTTLRAIAGFETITAGEIALGDELVAAPARGVFVPPERRQAGMVFQSYAVWPHMTVFENVAFPLRVRRLGRADLDRAVRDVLALVRLEALAGRYPHQLSGGQQQRVALARALVMRPAVLLLDEPLANLDANLREQMRFEIKDLQRRTGLTIVYVTHDQAEAMALSDRIVVMNAGRIEQIGPPRTIYERPASVFVASFVGVTNLLPVDLVDRRNGAAIVVPRGLPEPRPLQAAVSDETGCGDAVAPNGWLLSARPEDLELAEPADGDLPATVIRRTYLGAAIDYLLRVGSWEVRVVADKRRLLDEGAEVGLVFRRSRLLPAPGDADLPGAGVRGAEPPR